MKNFRFLLSILIIPMIFFLVSFFTLSDYGISWDEPIHFTRGQAYFNYFWDGSLTYKDQDFSKRQSIYKETSFTAEYFLKHDSGHPPLNGIFAAFTNFIFYQKLGILGDIQSYHLFNILCATLLVLVVVVFGVYAYGYFMGIMAGLILATYPLFFAESHFNIKDPAEAAFFGATIFMFWMALKKENWKWLLGSVIFFALALGTKFNILFLPFIILPWLFIKYKFSFSNLLKQFNQMPRNFKIVFFSAPFIIIIIFFITWPYLWQNPVNNTLNIFKYYQEIGTGGKGQINFLLPGNINIFPIVWIIITTPPLILFLTILGIATSLFIKDKEKTAILWLLWLLIPILRVSAPNSSIYGGIRQIMEFIPAMALLSGLGAYSLSKLLTHYIPIRLSLKIWQIIIILFFIPQIFILFKLHPNENVYFNFLIGGLKGAQERQIPYWGNSFGNAYYQAVAWLNNHAEPNSKVALVQGTMVNIPKIYFRKDILYSNSFWSGINRNGEYLVDLTHQGYQVAYPSAWEYINNVLIPIYEVKADGVAIAKIWKNDISHSKDRYKDEINLPIKNVQKSENILNIELNQTYSLSRIIINFNSNDNCKIFKLGTIETSIDGKKWRNEVEKISEEQIKEYPSLKEGLIRYIFPANEVRFIKIITDDNRSCLFNETKILVKGFK